MPGYRWIIGLFAVVLSLVLFAEGAFAKRKEEEPPKDSRVIAHIQFGVNYGFSSPDMVDMINDIAINTLNSEDRLGDFGLGFSFGLDILFNAKGPLWLGGGLGINTAKTHQNFKYYDAIGNFYNEYYGISLTVGSLDGLAMFRFNTKGSFSPYLFSGGGISLTVMNFDNYMVNIYGGEHFYWGQATKYSPVLRAGGGFDVPFFNLGQFFTQVSYTYPVGEFEVLGWGVKRDAWAVSFGLDRAF